MFKHAIIAGGVLSGPMILYIYSWDLSEEQSGLMSVTEAVPVLTRRNWL